MVPAATLWTMWHLHQGLGAQRRLAPDGAMQHDRGVGRRLPASLLHPPPAFPEQVPVGSGLPHALATLFCSS